MSKTISQKISSMNAVDGQSRESTLYIYVFSLILYLNSENVYFKKNDLISAIFELVLMGFLFLFLYKPFREGRINRLKYILLISLSYASLIFIIMVNSIDGNVISNVLQKIVIFCLLMPLFICMDSVIGLRVLIQKVMRAYVNIVVFFGVIGLVLWLGYNLNILKANMTCSYTWGGPQTAPGILGIICFPQVSDQSFAPGWARFSSIFIEGAIATGYFVFSLVMELYLQERPRFLICVVLLVCSACTLSTFGLLTALPVFVLGLFLSPSFQRLCRTHSLLYFLTGTCVVLAFLAVPIFLNFVFGSKTNKGSSDMHMLDFVAGFGALREAPLLGHGIGNYRAMSSYSPTGKTGLSSAMMMGFSQGGILYVLAIALPMIVVAILAMYWHNWRLLSASVIVLVLFINGSSDNSPMYAFMMAFFYYLILINKKFEQSQVAEEFEIIR